MDSNNNLFTLGESVESVPAFQPNYTQDLPALAAFLEREYGLEIKELGEVVSFINDDGTKRFWERAAEMMIEQNFGEIDKMKLDELIQNVAVFVVNRDDELAMRLQEIQKTPEYQALLSLQGN